MNQIFTYKGPELLGVGGRVLVPFGSRELIGVIVQKDVALPPNISQEKIKNIKEVIDLVPFFTEELMELAHWLAQYYAHPLGEVFKTMMPAESYVKKKEYGVLTEAGMLELRGEGDELGRGALLKALFNQRSKLSLAQLRKKWQHVTLLHEDWGRWDLKTLAKLRLMTIIKESQTKTRSIMGAKGQHSAPSGHLYPENEKEKEALPETDHNKDASQDFESVLLGENLKILTPRQREIFTEIKRHWEQSLRDKIYKPILLQGVTGSGKTEIYVHAMAHLFASGAKLPTHPQTLLLLPEIALTPQMTKIFTERFGAYVAVVHSGLLDAERARELERIRSGAARILIGPRSALFAPFQNLKLIIVDEEHDTSYKQTSGLTYHGRDFAIMRGQKEGALVILGSATPSLESYYNAKTGRYLWLKLLERVHTRPLPHVISLQSPLPKSTKELLLSQNLGAFKKTEPWQIPLHPEILTTMQKTLDAQQQIMVIVSRRGYASYLYDVSEGSPVQCPNCSISLTLHKNGEHLYCHYCGLRKHVKTLLQEKPEKSFLAIGYGSQKIERILKELFPKTHIARIDSDLTVQRHFLEKELAAFRAGETQMLVGTQLIAKGHDFPGVTLVVILDVDQLLDLPDLRAGERTFQLIVQAAGRAGRAENEGLVLLQTLRGDHPLLRLAAKQDFDGFADAELRLRQALDYPPFSRLIAIELSSTNVEKLAKMSQAINSWRSKIIRLYPDQFSKVKITPVLMPPIDVIKKKHRRSLLITTRSVSGGRKILDAFLRAFKDHSPGVDIKIDVDPIDFM